MSRKVGNTMKCHHRIERHSNDDSAQTFAGIDIVQERSFFNLAICFFDVMHMVNKRTLTGILVPQTCDWVYSCMYNYTRLFFYLF